MWRIKRNNMFISQKELERLMDERIQKDRNEYLFDNFFVENGGMIFYRRRPLEETIASGFKKIASLENYLNIRYEEKETKGYVKNKKK